MRRLWPRGLVGQLAILLLLALLAGQAVTFWIFTDERRLAIEGLRYQEALGRLALVLRLLRAAPPALQPGLVAAASGPEIDLRLTDSPAAELSARGHPLARLVAERLEVSADEVRVLLGPPRGRPRDLDPDQGRGWRHHWRPARIAVELTPGRWLEATARPRPRPNAFARATLVALLVTALALFLVVVVTARRITRPVRALALAADRLGRGEAVDALPERGPDELRRATRAFNAMQARLRRFVDDRTRLLAALGHDLRTPITALRLRAELVEDADARERLLATVEEMHQMVEATLAFAREEGSSEAAREVDLAALIEGLCEDLRELGHEVVFTGSDRLVARIRPSALRRALRNLIENAVTYGSRAEVALAAGKDEVWVTIDDVGPGIPEDQLEQVFQPFVRLEGSRSRETGGIGLGLAIARSIVRAHGGDIRLANRPGGGLHAYVSVPQRAEPA